MKETRGFTLSEVLITVAIIGIFASIVYASLDRIREESRDSSREAAIGQITVALKLYRSAHSEYPESDEGSIQALDVLVPDYLREFPADPKSDGSNPVWDGADSVENTYYYWRVSDGLPSGCSFVSSGGEIPDDARYILWYHLEGNDAGNAPSCLSLSTGSFTVIEEG